MLKNWLTLLIICALVLAAALLWDTNPQDFLGERSSEQAAQVQRHPSNILFDSNNQHFNEAGLLKSEFKARESRYFQINPKRRSTKDYTEVTAPYLTLYSPNKPPWYISATDGIAKQNGNLIELHGDVRIWQISATGERSELTTTYLVVKPQQQYAETNKAVMMSAPGNTTEAIGMQAFLQQDLIKLLARVRGIHEM